MMYNTTFRVASHAAELVPYAEPIVLVDRTGRRALLRILQYRQQFQPSTMRHVTIPEALIARLRACGVKCHRQRHDLVISRPEQCELAAVVVAQWLRRWAYAHTDRNSPNVRRKYGVWHKSAPRLNVAWAQHSGRTWSSLQRINEVPYTYPSEAHNWVLALLQQLIFESGFAYARSRLVAEPSLDGVDLHFPGGTLSLERVQGVMRLKLPGLDFSSTVGVELCVDHHGVCMGRYDGGAPMHYRRYSRRKVKELLGYWICAIDLMAMELQPAHLLPWPYQTQHVYAMSESDLPD